MIDKPLDSFTRAGAERVALNIAAYWRAKGYDVTPVIKRVKATQNEGFYTIQLPGFVNGTPPASARAANPLRRAA